MRFDSLAISGWRRSRAHRKSLNPWFTIVFLLLFPLLTGCGQEQKTSEAPADLPTGTSGPATPRSVSAEEQEKAWQQATQQNTVSAFTFFLRSFGDSKYAAEAKDRLQALEAQAAKEADERAWVRAAAGNDEAAIRQYVQALPAGSHIQEAQARLSTVAEEAARAR